MKTLLIIVATYAAGRIALHLITMTRRPSLWKFSLEGIRREFVK
jgi:hypothetical protein